METGGGYIKLFRKAQENFLYQENRPHTRREAWEDILLMVNHAEADVLVGEKKIICGRGQSIRSLDSWAKHFNWSKSKVKRFFDLLKREKMIVTENVQKTTRLTVCNYDAYQGERNNDGTMMAQSRPTNNKNKKNNKNIEGVEHPSPARKKKMFTPPSFQEVEAYATSRGRTDLTKSFFDYYDAGSWSDKDGKPVKNWKQKFISWENRSPKAEAQQKNKNQLDLTGRW